MLLEQVVAKCKGSIDLVDKEWCVVGDTSATGASAAEAHPTLMHQISDAYMIPIAAVSVHSPLSLQLIMEKPP